MRGAKINQMRRGYDIRRRNGQKFAFIWQKRTLFEREAVGYLAFLGFLKRVPARLIDGSVNHLRLFVDFLRRKI